MNALTFSAVPELGNARGTLEKLRAKCGPLSTVVVVHVALFYFAYSGMMSRMVDAAIPQAVLVSFVAPPPPPKAPPPAMPKLVPLVQLPPPVLPSVPVPVVHIAPQPNVVTVTQTSVPAEPRPVQVASVSVPAAPTPAVSSTPKTITTGIEFIQPPQLIYPKMSLKMGEAGVVLLRILVNEKGIPSTVQVHKTSGFARIDEAGRQAALRAHFKPFTEDGRPIPAYVLVPLNFQLSS